MRFMSVVWRFREESSLEDSAMRLENAEFLHSVRTLLPGARVELLEPYAFLMAYPFIIGL
jgi:hypothetical protein